MCFWAQLKERCSKNKKDFRIEENMVTIESTSRLSNQDSQVSAFIVDNHDVVAESLASVLRSVGIVTTVLDVEDLSIGSAVGAVTRQRSLGSKTLVALIDLNLKPDLDGADLIAPLTLEGVKVVVVSGVADRVRLGGCIAMGAVALINKGRPLDVLLLAISRIVAGESSMSLWEREALLAEYWESESNRQRQLAMLGRLTNRENQVLNALVGGLVAAEIAEEVYISISTARSEIRSILTKLGVHSQLDAIELALQARWTPDFVQSDSLRKKFHQPW